MALPVNRAHGANYADTPHGFGQPIETIKIVTLAGPIASRQSSSSRGHDHHILNPTPGPPEYCVVAKRVGAVVTPSDQPIVSARLTLESTKVQYYSNGVGKKKSFRGWFQFVEKAFYNCFGILALVLGFDQSI